MHSGLLKLALDDPVYLQCWGRVVGQEDSIEKLFIYVNLIVSYWEAKWDLGGMDSKHARRMATSFFASEIPRAYWEKYGRKRRADFGGNKRRKFYDVLDDEYRKAIASGPPERALSVSGATIGAGGAANVSAFQPEQHIISRLAVETMKIGATAIALWVIMRPPKRY
jgi:hypothetical protein